MPSAGCEVIQLSTQSIVAEQADRKEEASKGSRGMTQLREGGLFRTQTVGDTRRELNFTSPDELLVREG